MARKSAVSRRSFLKGTAGMLCLPAMVPRSVLGRTETAPSNRIAVGLVGAGSRGCNVMEEFLKEGDAQIVAVCDVQREHYRDRPWGEGPVNGRDGALRRIAQHYEKAGTPAPGEVAVYTDYREVCARKDLDAVIVATPDHWHALCTLEALAQGKDVYCEKPVTHFFAEGLTVCREVEKRKAIFQTGSQQRSMAPFRHAVELIRNGHLGKLLRVEVGLPGGLRQAHGRPGHSRSAGRPGL